tara:strand:+ start:262 stop:1188 length:927 start_codon:yes stop_codon:yes gene_type:complete
MMKIAILGSTGHVGKNLTYYFGNEYTHELFLFSRNEKKLEKTVSQLGLKKNFSVRTYDEFNNSKYDVVINCVGISDPAKIKSSQGTILETTEKFDTMTLDYLERFPESKLINFSSGIVYGGNFSSPITKTILIDENFDGNEKDGRGEYALSKINSEIKHRMLKSLNIIDFRLFSFFSRFINLDAKFLMCEVISSIMQNKKFLTDETDIYRDYIHPKDLFLYVKKCMAKDSLNDVFDICSKKPIGKFELLNFLKEKYGLQYEIEPGVKSFNPTGFKRNYYSESRKAESLGYKPEYSSIGTISDEISFII